MKELKRYLDSNKARFLNELLEILRIPSVSTDPKFTPDVRRMAEATAQHLKAVGLDKVEVCETAGHPIVYGEKMVDPEAPTVLVYGHYDVQPAKIEDGWNTPPFEPVEIDGIIYARGSSDDKGQMFIHIKAFESFLATEGTAPVNFKFIIEGEEEIGSLNLLPFLQAHSALLKADVCVISDTGMRDINQPAITYGLRGLTYMQVDVVGPSRDLHSGGYGGIIHNPALALAQILSKLHNADNSVAVPGFYDDVLALTPD